MKNIYLTIILASVLVPSASALIIYIPADYATIQEGVDAAVNGDTVLVAPGEYLETITVENKNILLTAEQGPENTTILGRLIVQGTEVDTTCVFRGFTVTLNEDDPGAHTYSLVRIRYASPLIEGNIIKDNETTAMGAGINCGWSNAIIRSNVIRNNLTTFRAGGILASDGVIIENNIIANNRAGYSACEFGDAGGISAAGPVSIMYNLIINNEAFRYICNPYGGGIRKIGTLHTFILNNTIVANSAKQEADHGIGGGIYISGIEFDIQGVIKNNIVAFNPFGGGVYAELIDSEEVDWDYNLVFGNDSADYIGIEPGPHDIQENPLFVDRFSGDYQLLENSPCIDAGDPDFPLDPDGTRADIGAYYFDQRVGIDDDGNPSGPYQFQLRQNYPNPFNSETIISYYLPQQAIVSLQIFSITGHFVKTLANKEAQSEGEHKIAWDGTDKNGETVGTGIYFYELYVDDHRESKAMIMLK